MVIGHPKVEVNALHYTPFDLDGPSHPYKLKRRDDIALRINHKQMGLGGDDSWGARPHEEYMLRPNRTYRYGYTLRPIPAGTADLMAWSKPESTEYLIRALKVDGKPLEEFHPEQFQYTYRLLRGSSKVPVVEAETVRSDVRVQISPAVGVNGKTVISVSSADGQMTAVYEIQFVVTDHYLSDMEWVSATAGWETVQRDRSVEGNPLRLRGQNGIVTYEKGIGTHADSEIIYDLSGKNAAEFTAIIGVDQEVNSPHANYNTVVFQVFLDGEKVYDSGVMRASTPAKEIRIDVRGKRELKLVVTDAGDGNAEDHADWADAKLIPAAEPSGYLAGPEEVQAGETIDLTFGLDNVRQQVFAQDATIQYDADWLEFASADAADDAVFVVGAWDQDGRLRVIAANTNGGRSNGDMVILRFRAKSAEDAAAVNLSVTRLIVADRDGNETELKGASHRIAIREMQPGDLNRDGRISIGDLAIMAAHYGKDASHPNWDRIRRMDLDENGTIDIGDLSIVARRMIES